MAEIRFEELGKQEGLNLSLWKRTYGISKDGEFYVPAAIAGDEQKIMMCASYDGIGIAHYKNHLYIPLTWAKKEFPDAAEVWNAFENMMRGPEDSATLLKAEQSGPKD